MGRCRLVQRRLRAGGRSDLVEAVRFTLARVGSRRGLLTLLLGLLRRRVPGLGSSECGLRCSQRVGSGLQIGAGIAFGLFEAGAVLRAGGGRQRK
ncbi:MAG: hypothetical protein IT536_16065 [Hyphomicrobiales bacterium]|nr:hypothetical protein [Hyphomicrobiales bacterium]